MKKKVKKPGKLKVEEPQSNSELKKDNEKPFTYGGLPQRDLKKNLGCG